MLMGMRPADLAAEADIPLFSAIAHTGLTHADLQTANGSLEQDASRQRQLRNRTRTPLIGMTQGVEPQIFAATDPVTDPATEQGAYYGREGFAESAGPMKRVRRPRSARPNTGLPAWPWPVAERLTDTKLVF